MTEAERSNVERKPLRCIVEDSRASNNRKALLR
jgi:hypothetical protein